MNCFTSLDVGCWKSILLVQAVLFLERKHIFKASRAIWNHSIFYLYLYLYYILFYIVHYIMLIMLHHIDGLFSISLVVYTDLKLQQAAFKTANLWNPKESPQQVNLHHGNLCIFFTTIWRNAEPKYRKLLCLSSVIQHRFILFFLHRSWWYNSQPFESLYHLRPHLELLRSLTKTKLYKYSLLTHKYIMCTIRKMYLGY